MISYSLASSRVFFLHWYVNHNEVFHSFHFYFIEGGKKNLVLDFWCVFLFSSVYHWDDDETASEVKEREREYSGESEWVIRRWYTESIFAWQEIHFVSQKRSHSLCILFSFREREREGEEEGEGERDMIFPRVIRATIPYAPNFPCLDCYTIEVCLLSLSREVPSQNVSLFQVLWLQWLHSCGSFSL